MKASHAKVASLPTRDDDGDDDVVVVVAGEMSGEKIAARTERTTRKPRMGHAMATAGRGPRLLRKGSLLRPGSLLKVCLSSCGAKLALAGCYVVWRHSTHFLRQLGDGDKAQDSAALVYNWQTKKFSLYKTCTLSVSYTHVAH